ncbi:hypothetical protein KY290_011118 [Solanum tuberosum]|uniref:Uncharacterized protein n=1 Tax=Solanum tuberosum TaxID=4113 RepID=A0ABQ7VZP4_SOLTU|nr:hypothetical protein KY290_011118 [Solanum tuberosum]
MLTLGRLSEASCGWKIWIISKFNSSQAVDTRNLSNLNLNLEFSALDHVNLGMEDQKENCYQQALRTFTLNITLGDIYVVFQDISGMKSISRKDKLLISGKIRTNPASTQLSEEEIRVVTLLLPWTDRSLGVLDARSADPNSDHLRSATPACTPLAGR